MLTERTPLVIGETITQIFSNNTVVAVSTLNSFHHLESPGGAIVCVSLAVDLTGCYLIFNGLHLPTIKFIKGNTTLHNHVSL